MDITIFKDNIEGVSICSVNCAVCVFQCAMCSVQFAVSNAVSNALGSEVKCAVCSVQCAVYSVKCGVQRALQSEQYEMCSVFLCASPHCVACSMVYSVQYGT